MVKVMSQLIKPERALRFVFGARAKTEMNMWGVTDMCVLKAVKQS